ncbi:MAG: GTPase ObgE [Clostridia bacterium]|nr:GTPase ObgE [Clostridia bacterium]MBQ4455344.1 GTPase ObgE [Clostridia bacterium]MBQ5956669.1 GTPase ObgE [Clostridia bacterium]MBQ6003210.1 GTPase ObgE [Clostridia bacterium]MBR6135913.1 GTPase ObgE [Clostridia bacterium]
MLVDRVKLNIKAGNGGDGAVSFRREKYVPNGGPDGGDGGTGGDIIIRSTRDLHTLYDLRFHKIFRAGNGEKGGARNMSGKDGTDVVIKVPVGTAVIDAETGRVIADFNTEEERIILKGGKGGKGNARFATPTRQAPKFATPGKKTIEREIILDLKSIADAGLVGYPSVGKSTLLSVVSAARPKIADYHFTTLSPNLGVVSVGDDGFILADIPGLIEGASQGVGLGHDFLKHIERTRLIVHMVDASGIEGRMPLEDYYAIRKELSEYSQELAEKKEIVVACKMDLSDSDIGYEMLREDLEPKGIEVFPISAVTGAGVKELMQKIMETLKEIPEAESLEEEGYLEEWSNYNEAFSFEITTAEDGVVEANGTLIDFIFERIDPEDTDSMRHFEKLLVDYGIIDALRRYGVKDGQEIRMNGEEFDFVE